MDQKLDFSLPGDAGRVRAPRVRSGLLWCIVLLQVAALALLVLGRQGGVSVDRGEELSADQLRDLAQRLEKQGLAGAAAGTWQEYLRVRQGDAAGAAAIWYRIGKIHQDAGNYEAALASFYRSESVASLDNLEDEVGRRVQECLQALGEFAALRYELADRVGIDSGGERASAERVLAEIGPVRITQSGLDRQIEAMAEQQLSQVAPFMSPAELNEQKEALLKRFSSAEGRARILQQFITREVLYRKALEDKLTEDPAVRALLLQADRDILAQQALSKTLAERITITSDDVETFYEANKESFKTPVAVKAAHILVPDEEKADAVRNSLGKGTPFEDLARDVSTDAATAENGGVLPEWIEAGAVSVPGIGQAPEFVRTVLSTEPGVVADANVKTPAGIHVVKVLEKREARQRPFAEVREEAYRRLRSRKERSVQEQLLDELRDAYDVVIHTKAFSHDEPSSESGD